jgi:hypothetical protein
MKAQGLPISAVILIIMGLVILVLAIVFIVIPIYKTSGAITPPSTNISAFEFTCNTACSIANSPTPSSTAFCTDTMPGYSTLHCYSKVPGTSSYFYGTGSCTYTDSFGVSETANQGDC